MFAVNGQLIINFLMSLVEKLYEQNLSFCVGEIQLNNKSYWSLYIYIVVHYLAFVIESLYRNSPVNYFISIVLEREENRVNHTSSFHHLLQEVNVNIFVFRLIHIAHIVCVIIFVIKSKLYPHGDKRRWVTLLDAFIIFWKKYYTINITIMAGQQFPAGFKSSQIYQFVTIMRWQSMDEGSDYILPEHSRQFWWKC